ncbi:MAG: hypothetical protein FWD97_00055 [Defluviitaleaceae bacterium]|nr:hypothetical protein [Defluviitaleaceae bacterium]
MKRKILGTLLALCGLVLVACNGEQQVDDTRPYQGQETTDTNQQQTTEYPETLEISINIADDAILAGFNQQHRYNYSNWESVTIAIWANQPMRNLAVVSLSSHWDEERQQLLYSPTARRGETPMLAVGDGFVIKNYVGAGTLPVSGIAFTDINGNIRHFAMQENNAYPNHGGMYVIWEIEVIDWQQAADTLINSMDSIFTEVLWMWGNDGTAEINFRPSEQMAGFYNSQGNRFDDSLPWIYRFQDSFYFADYYKIIDLDRDGIPEILIHFHQTFEGCYGGFYRIFSYRNGRYEMLEMSAYGDGWLHFGSGHQLFVDGYGRTIALIDSELSGMEYTQLVIEGNRATFYPLALPEWTQEQWREHHWQVWSQETWELLDSWLDHNPTIFGTDIPLTPIQPWQGRDLP